MRGLLLLFFVVECQAVDPSMWRDLDVSAAPLGSAVSVNGLPLQVIHFTGTGVATLEQRWRAKTSSRSMSVAPWRIHSRLAATHSEVLQVRVSGSTTAEAIWSRLGFDVGAAGTWPARFEAPSSCTAGRAIEGRGNPGRYRLQAWQCTATPTWLIETTAARLSRQGFHLKHGQSDRLEASDNRRRIHMHVLQSAIVVLEEELVP